MKKITLRVAAMIMAILAFAAVWAPGVAATSSTTTTTQTNTGSRDISFEMETDVTQVRTKGIVNLSVIMTNNSAKDIYELEFSVSFDDKRILGFTTDYTTTLNGVTKPNNDSPVVLRQQGNVVKVFNYDPTDTTFAHTPLPSGKTLKVVFPMVVSESAELGDILFTVSDAKATDSSGKSLTVGGYPNAKVKVVPVASDATLSSIVVSVNDAPITLTPAFSPDISSYSAVVGNSIPSLKFNVQCTDDRATFTTDKPSQLTVGNNTFKFTVTAEDKTTTKTYTVIIRRLAPGETTTLNTTTTTTTTESTTTTTTTTSATPATTAPTVQNLPSGTTAPPTEPSTPGTDKDGSKVTLNLAALLGIVAAAIALFLLAFSAGYITHKNASQPQKYSVEELMEAQEKLDMQNRLAMQQAGQYPADAAYQQYQTGYQQMGAGYGATEFGGYDPNTVASFEQPSLYPMTASYDQNAYAAEEFTLGAQPEGSVEYGAPQDMSGMPEPNNGGEYGAGDVYYQ